MNPEVEKCIRLRKSLLDILESFEFILNKPMLFINDYFYSIRNEIDIEAETFHLNNPMQGDNNLQNSAEPNKLNSDTVNKIRETMINELKIYEQKCIERATNHDLHESQTALNEYKQDFKESNLDYEKISENLLRDLYKLKANLLNNQSFFFKKQFLNDFGVLVIFEEAYLNEIEIKCIKYVDIEYLFFY